MASRRLLLALLLAAACSRTTFRDSAADRLAAPESELDFWDALAERRAVTNSDALHALLLYAGSPGTGFEERLRSARAKGWVAEGAALPAQESAEAGLVARAVCMEFGVRGGLTMRLFGPSRRYALKELAYLGWLPEMGEGQALSGLQLIALLSAADDHRKGRA